VRGKGKILLSGSALAEKNRQKRPDIVRICCGRKRGRSSPTRSEKSSNDPSERELEKKNSSGRRRKRVIFGKKQFLSHRNVRGKGQMGGGGLVAWSKKEGGGVSKLAYLGKKGRKTKTPRKTFGKGGGDSPFPHRSRERKEKRLFCFERENTRIQRVAGRRGEMLSDGLRIGPALAKE